MIYIFTAVLLLAVICLMVICIQLLQRNKALKTHVNVLNKDYENLLNENISLIDSISNTKSKI